jgi:hypothetical protein
MGLNPGYLLKSFLLSLRVPKQSTNLKRYVAGFQIV